MSLIDKILVPTDFSDCARGALDYGAALSQRFGAPLLLLHVYANPVVPVPDGYVMMTPTDVAKMMSQLESGLGKAKAYAEGHGATSVETAIAEGAAWHEIVRIAKDRGCNLIVMGTHGRGGLSHLVLGSVAEKVVRKADCAVLTVGPKARG